MWLFMSLLSFTSLAVFTVLHGGKVQLLGRASGWKSLRSNAGALNIIIGTGEAEGRLFDSPLCSSLRSASVSIQNNPTISFKWLHFSGSLQWGFLLGLNKIFPQVWFWFSLPSASLLRIDNLIKRSSQTRVGPKRLMGSCVLSREAVFYPLMEHYGCTRSTGYLCLPCKIQHTKLQG